MVLFFENSYGEQRKIGEPANEKEACDMIQSFCEERNFPIPYWRGWVQNGEIHYDVGSYTEFFVLKGGDFTDVFNF